MTLRRMKLLNRTHRCHLHHVPLLSLRQQLQDDHGPAVQDVMDMVTTLQRSLIGSHGKLESLFQKTSTVLAAQHEAMTALISSCKQQVDIVESLVRQGPDWS